MWIPWKGAAAEESFAKTPKYRYGYIPVGVGAAAASLSKAPIGL